MAYFNKNMITSADGHFCPQKYDQANDTFIPYLQMEYYGLSTDTKPSPANTPKGATFLEIDTKTVYINNSSAWVVF